MKEKHSVLVDIALLFSIAHFLSELVIKGFIPLNLYLFYGAVLVGAVSLNLPLIHKVLRLLLPFVACTTLFINLWYLGKPQEVAFYAILFIVWISFYLFFGGIARLFRLF